jgi:hypothetical protein
MLGDLKHLVGTRRRKNIAHGTSIQQPVTHVAQENWQMTGTASGRECHLAANRRVGSHDTVNVVAGEAQHVSVGPKQPVQHLDYKLVGIVKYLLHVPSIRNHNSDSVGEDHGPFSPALSALSNDNALVKETKGALVTLNAFAFCNKKRGVTTGAFRSLCPHGYAMLAGEAEDLLLFATDGATRRDDAAKFTLGRSAMVFDGQFEWNYVTLLAAHYPEDMCVIGVTASRDLCSSVFLQVCKMWFSFQAASPAQQWSRSLLFLRAALCQRTAVGIRRLPYR